jgi:hypothetical protein
MLNTEVIDKGCTPESISDNFLPSIPDFDNTAILAAFRPIGSDPYWSTLLTNLSVKLCNREFFAFFNPFQNERISALINGGIRK